MITDNIKYHKLYRSLHPGVPKAFDYILGLGKELRPGKAEIDGDSMFAIFSDGTAPVREVKLEAHRKYLDLHYVISGSDTMGCKPLQRCSAAEGEYNDAGDYLLFSDQPEYKVLLQPGDFALCFPQDAHMPLQGEGPYTKVVIKIKI